MRIEASTANIAINNTSPKLRVTHDLAQLLRTAQMLRQVVLTKREFALQRC